VGGSPAGERGVPVQELGGEPLTVNQLERVRTVCDPTPTFTAPIDSMIIHMRPLNSSFEAIAKAIALPGFTANRISKRWHNHLKWLSTNVKSQPSQHHLPAAYATRWTLGEHISLAETAAVVGASGMYDEQCVGGDCWETIARMEDNGRSPAATKRRFETRIRKGRPCSSHGCPAMVAFGETFCEEHVDIYKMDNQLALGACAAHAEVARQEGWSLPTVDDGTMGTDDEAVKTASADADAWRRVQVPTASSDGTFTRLALVPFAAAAAHSTPSTRTTLAAVVKRAQAGTPKSFYTVVVATATASNVAVILELPVSEIMYYVAVLPQAKDEGGHVGNYLTTEVVVLCPVDSDDGLKRAVALLSAHSSLYTTALFGFKLRKAFQVLEPDDLKCQPPRTP
jgi:hypothetical protein